MSSESDIEGERLRASLLSRMFGARVERPRVGKYLIDTPLGEGAMGAVYRAFDPDLERPVALKLLRTESGDGGAAQRFVREAKALARLNHPNVVTIHEAGLHDDRLFIAMELVEGANLDGWARANPPDSSARFREALRLMLRAADGLAAAHQAGIVHRDLKPANILIGTDGRLRLADFGLARSDRAPELVDTRDEGSSRWNSVAAHRLTVTGRFVGTPAYMAPEQFEGQTDTASDQFGFCATFFELIYGVRPYQGRTIAELRAAIDNHRIKSPRTVGVPRWMHGILARGLRPNPDDRFPSMTALVRAISAADRGAKRSRLLGAAGVAGLGVGITAAAWPRDAEPANCETAGAEIDDVWGSTRRTSVQAAFEQTGAPFAPATFAEVDARLSAFADRWRAQRRILCEAGSEPGAALQAECLHDALAGFDATIEVLEEAELEGLIEAPAVATAVPEISACAEGTRRDDAPRGENARDLVRRLARGRALAGVRDEQAAGLLTDVANDARRGALPVIEAQASILLAGVDLARDDLDASLQWAERALRASEDAGDAETEVEAWVRLARTQDKAGLDAAFSVRRAESALERVAQPRWRAAHVASARGQVLGRTDSKAAVASLQVAAELAADHVEERPLMLASILADLGSAQVRVGSIRDGTRNLAASVQTYERVYGEHSPRVALPLAVHASALLHGDEIAESLAAAERASRLLATVPTWNPGLRVAIARLRGSALRSLGRPEEAVTVLREGIEVGAGATNANARTNVRTARLSLGDALGALDRWHEAIEVYTAMLADESPDDGRANTRGALRLNLAIAYGAIGESELATRYAQEGRRLIEETEDPGTTPHTDMLRVLASIWADIGNYEAGLRDTEAGLRDETLSDRMRGQLLFYRAKALAGLGRHEDADDVAQRARELFVALGPDGAGLLQDLDAWRSELP